MSKHRALREANRIFNGEVHPLEALFMAALLVVILGAGVVGGLMALDVLTR